jgi:hypothetical protein
MGYYVTNHEIDYTVPADKVAALEKKHPGLLGLLEDFCFRVDRLKNGEVVIDMWEGDKWSSHEGLLNDLSEFCIDGSGSKWSGEEGENWEYRVHGGKVVEINVEQEAEYLREAFKTLLAKYPEEAAQFVNSQSVWIGAAVKEILEGG